MAEFTEGDFVEHTDHGQGVVTGVMKESFEFPTSEGDTEKIDASADSPVYIVALMEGGIASATSSELDGISGLEGDGADVTSPDDAASKVDDAKLSSWYEDKREAELLRLPGADDPEVGFENLPDGWTRKSILQGWASLGGTWRSAYAKMLTHFGPFTAKRLASAWKDEALMTEEWRGKL